jgi:hypothetical protein
MLLVHVGGCFLIQNQRKPRPALCPKPATSPSQPVAAPLVAARNWGRAQRPRPPAAAAPHQSPRHHQRDSDITCRPGVSFAAYLTREDTPPWYGGCRPLPPTCCLLFLPDSLSVVLVMASACRPAFASLA